MRRRIAVAAVVVGLLLGTTPGRAATVLVASAARATSSTSTLSPADIALIKNAVFLLNVTAAATEVTDTLDVYIQQSADGGTTWDDFIHFTQVLGTGGAKKYIATWSREAAAESEMKAATDAGIAAGVLQGPVTSTWRAKWVIVDAGTVNASFAFSISMEGVSYR